MDKNPVRLQESQCEMMGPEESFPEREAFIRMVTLSPGYPFLKLYRKKTISAGTGVEKIMEPRERIRMMTEHCDLSRWAVGALWEKPKFGISFSKNKRGQSQGEEIANSISHGIGLLGALIGTPILIMHALRQGDAGFMVGSIVFSASMILLYFASTIYHAWPMGKAKQVFRTIEHSAIFILIAGTYTPLTLCILRGGFGWTIFGIIWGLAAAGVVLKAFYKAKHPIFSTCLYLLMGWLIVIAAKPLFAIMPPSGLFLLISGGLSYTAGVTFFATGSRIPYGHMIWHLFVIAGTACHYFLVLWYAA